MAISVEMKLAAPTHVLVQELEGESVLLNLKGEHYFGLDETGTQMWKCLANARSIKDAEESLLSQYEVDRETLRRDLEELVEKLVKRGLLKIAGTEDE